jgi:hypothetical protein
MDQEQNINHTPEVITPQQAPTQPQIPLIQPQEASPYPQQASDQQIQPSIATPTINHAVSEHPHHSQHSSHLDNSEKSKFARMAFIGGLIAVILSFAIPHLSIITSATNNIPFFTTYGILAIICAVSIGMFAIPSFKKNKYPNLFGLIGLMLSLIVLYGALSVLIVYIFNGNN